MSEEPRNQNARGTVSNDERHVERENGCDDVRDGPPERRCGSAKRIERRPREPLPKDSWNPLPSKFRSQVHERDKCNRSNVQKTEQRHHARQESWRGNGYRSDCKPCDRDETEIPQLLLFLPPSNG